MLQYYYISKCSVEFSFRKLCVVLHVHIDHSKTRIVGVRKLLA